MTSPFVRGGRRDAGATFPNCYEVITAALAEPAMAQSVNECDLWQSKQTVVGKVALHMGHLPPLAKVSNEFEQ